MFLGIHYGERCRVDNVLDVAVALQYMDGFARAHEDRPDGSGSPQAGHELESDVSCLERREYEDVRLVFECVEVVDSVEYLGDNRCVRLHFSIDDQIRSPLLDDPGRKGHLVGPRVTSASEVAEG